MATADWIKEAEEQAKRYSDSIKTSNQYLIDQLNQAKNNSLAQLEQQQNAALEKLQKQQDNAIYNLNSQKSDIYKTATDNAQQLNINRLLNLRDNEQALNRAGLGTQGLVGSQVNSINNAYGKDLTSVLNQRTKDLNNLALQLQNTNLGYDTSRIDLGNQYNTNRLNLENEYSSNLANLQREIENQALNQYNNIYNNYLNMKQQEYQNEEAKRQFELELALKQAAQDEAKRQWQAEFDLAKQQAKKSSSGGGGSKKSGGSVPVFRGNNPKEFKSPKQETTPKMTFVAQIGAVPIYTNGNGRYYMTSGDTYVDVTDKYGSQIKKLTSKTSNTGKGNSGAKSGGR